MTPSPPRAPRGPAGGRRTLRALAAGALATALAALSLYGGPLSGGAAAAATPTAAAPTADPVTVTLSGVSPTIARPGNPVVLSGTLRNTGTTAIDTATVRARLSTTGLQTRAGVESWAAGDSPRATGPVVASEDLTAPLPAGGTASFRLTIPADAVRNGEGFAALPLAVDADTGSTVLGQARTFLPWYYKKEFVAPLALTTVVPLTLDADPSPVHRPGRRAQPGLGLGDRPRLPAAVGHHRHGRRPRHLGDRPGDPRARRRLGRLRGQHDRPRRRQRPDPDGDPDTARRRAHAPGRRRRAGPDVGPGLPARRRLGRARPVGAALRRPGHRHGPDRPDRRRPAGPTADAGHDAAPVGAHRHRLAGRQPVAGAAGARPAADLPGPDRRRRVHLRPDPGPGLHRRRGAQDQRRAAAAGLRRPAERPARSHLRRHLGRQHGPAVPRRDPDADEGVPRPRALGPRHRAAHLRRRPRRARLPVRRRRRRPVAGPDPLQPPAVRRRRRGARTGPGHHRVRR